MPPRKPHTSRQDSAPSVSPLLSLVQPVGAVPAPFLTVALGASAGGLGALEAFFSGMPTDREPGMAFVIIQHQAPDHRSLLVELVGRLTRMEVVEAADGMVVRPNRVYIMPPNHDMAILDGALQLLEPSAPRGFRLTVDFFFRALAQDQRERAVGIVLSGTGSDGTRGARLIKGEGGLVMAQRLASAEHQDMPRGVINAGLADYELEPAAMPAQLLAYAAQTCRRPGPEPALATPLAEQALKKVFILLRTQTGHDFSLYKPSTIHRRIERRMAVHQIESIDGYLKHLQEHPTEVEALFRDLLIGVTNFFRDRDAFRMLEEQVLPELFARKPAGSVIRVWCPGCSTGEEAYSIAILLQERLEILKQGYTVQVFATDIDAEAIAKARTGIYPSSIAVDLTPERIGRFFILDADGGSYRIHKGIRDLLVFSEQDVIKDPPFSKLDLISCRNLLIYMGSELQRKLIPLFHYALNPGGVLFLGSSETVGDFGDQFITLDRKLKMYQRKEGFSGTQRSSLSRFIPPIGMSDPTGPMGGQRPLTPAKVPLREITEQALLLQVSPAAALVNNRGDILYLHGRTGKFLELAPGEVGVNILKMAKEGLRRELTTALHKACSSGETVVCRGLKVSSHDHPTALNLTVGPVTPGAPAPSDPQLYLVVLEEIPLAESVHPMLPGEFEPDAEARITALQRELRAKEEYLQTANEELETSNEELRSSNEEMQSVNEELQSTNEELETSKEELQSVNEELATVNTELQAKVLDLSRANNDMNNLLAGTGIGTVFVDHQLHILRFTPAVTRIINLIQGDVGRPVGHIVSNLVGYDRLVADVQQVLDTLVPREIEVQTTDDRWFTMRIQPYRTLDNVIEGAVITFVDITDVKRTALALKRSETLLSTTQRLIGLGGWEWDVQRKTMFWTDELHRLHGVDPGDIPLPAPNLLERLFEAHPESERPRIREAFRRCAELGVPYDLKVPFISLKGRQLWTRTAAEPILEGNKIVKVVGFIMDVSDPRP